MPETDCDQYLSRWAQLQAERASWLPHWQEISRRILPRNGRYFADDRNRGERRNTSIYDSTATRALRTMAAGLMAGATSPARPWFRLTTSNPALDESDAVKQWLADVTRLMQMVFAKSNLYNALHNVYEEMGAFGTAASIVLPDFDSVIHCYNLTAGEYCIATDARGRVDTLYREFQMTAAQMAGEFGYDNCSRSTQRMCDGNNLDQWITVMHVIEPRRDRDVTRRDNRNMPFKSVYFEYACRDKVLRESGFKTFPAIAPRWAVSGGDIYGNSPAMDALGDINQLQHDQYSKSVGMDFETNPPIVVPAILKNESINRMPGGITFSDGQEGIQPLYKFNRNLDHLLMDIQDIRGRINSSFFVDIFLMLANGDNPQMTATEVAERKEEKMLMIGPVLERLHDEMLNPLIEMTFERMLAAGIVPRAPDELRGMELNVEFVSVLAQAQRAIAVNSVDRFVVSLGQIAQIDPQVLDKLDADYWADYYSDTLGVDPKLVRGNKDVALIRQQRAQQQQAARQQQAMQQQADAAQKLGSIDTSGQNALADAMRNLSGYT